MRCLNRYILLLLFAGFLSGIVAAGQTPGGKPANGDEDLRQTVRELALRATALEEELQREGRRQARRRERPLLLR
jgi:hypothetical protein